MCVLELKTAPNVATQTGGGRRECFPTVEYESHTDAEIINIARSQHARGAYSPCHESHGDMVQDSVGISLFATKNNVKRQERGMTLRLKWRYIPQILKHRNVSSRRCQCNHSFSASQDIPNMVKPRNINTHQIDTSLGHLLKPLNH